MESIKKQASKLREQVAKQQQAVFKQFSGRFVNDIVIPDESDLQCHQQLQKLYSSTKAAKHFQRSVVRNVEGLISVSSKQMEIDNKLAEDCCKYGKDNESSDFALAKVSLHFGSSHLSMEKEREILLRILGDQVFEPLRAMIMAAPLEDARHLTYRYERIRQDAEAQAIEVAKRQFKAKEGGASADSATKLHHAESKLSELRSIMSALGREAVAAMMAVEAQQQQVTFQKLLSMVEAERSYHQSVASILDKLHAEMILEEQKRKAALQTANLETDLHAPTTSENAKSDQSGDLNHVGRGATYYIAEVVHPFDAQADGELSLSQGDYVVVRQVAQNGWSEGECRGKAGWFPSAYVQQRDKAPASKVIESSSSP